MTMTVNPWWVIAVLSLALFGVVFVWRAARDAARDLSAWLRRDRMTPLLEADRPEGMLCAGCAGDSHCDGVEGGCDCTCGWDEYWAEELPPERSWEDMTAEAGGAGSSPAWVPGRRPVFPGVSVDSTPSRRSLMGPAERAFWAELEEFGPHGLLRLEARRERLASAAELEHRAAYEAMGLEFPSGLLARVREAAQ